MSIATAITKGKRRRRSADRSLSLSLSRYTHTYIPTEKALAEENEKIAKAEVSSLHEKLTTLEAKAYGDVSNLREDFHTVKVSVCMYVR